MYKRQAYRNKGVQKLLDAIVEYMPAPTDIPSIKGTDLEGNEIERHSSDDEPVSYTHLDVYKRQATTRDLSYLRVTRLRQAMLSQTVLQQVRESLLLERTRLSDS